MKSFRQDGNAALLAWRSQAAFPCRCLTAHSDAAASAAGRLEQRTEWVEGHGRPGQSRHICSPDWQPAGSATTEARTGRAYVDVPMSRVPLASGQWEAFTSTNRYDHCVLGLGINSPST